jgi:UDP-N-acetylglucosamine 2-epimerase (non-hydrolysing)
MPKPDNYLDVGSGSHAEQTDKVIMAYEKILIEHRPTMVIVVGIVDSTMAASIAAAKVVYPNNNLATQPNQLKSFNHRLPLIAHLESGLRSFDRSILEEINRLVADVLADILWVPSVDTAENLVR